MKHYGKLTAAAAAGFMTLSAMGVAPVFAEGVTTGSEVDITKTLTLTDGVKPATAVKFSYTVTPAEDKTVPASGLAADTVFNGVAGGLTASDAEQDTVAKDVMSFTGAKLTAHADRFTYPGIYQYTLTETAHDATTSKEYEDITNDSDNRYVVKVYVGYNTAGSLEVTNLEVSTDGSNNTKTNDLSFASTYDPATLTVTKEFAGNQAFSTDTFDFDVQITGKAGEQYIIKYDGKQVADINIGADGSATATITGVGKDKSFEIIGLSDTDSYIITEKADTMKGYTSSWTDRTLTGITTADKTETVTNTKNGTVPTGILMSAAPYAGLVALGGIFAGLFFRRKRED